MLDRAKPHVAACAPECEKHHALSGPQTAILLYVAMRAASGNVWESQETIATNTRFSPRTVRRVLHDLTALRLLSSLGRFGAPNVYSLRQTPVHRVESIGLNPAREAELDSDRVESIGLNPAREAELIGHRGRGLTLREIRQEREREEGNPSPGDARGKVSAQKTWKAVLDMLATQMTKPSFHTWMKNTRGGWIKGACLVVLAPDTYRAEMLARHLQPQMIEALRKETGGQLTDVRVTVERKV